MSLPVPRPTNLLASVVLVLLPLVVPSTADEVDEQHCSNDLAHSLREPSSEMAMLQRQVTKFPLPSFWQVPNFSFGESPILEQQEQQEPHARGGTWGVATVHLNSMLRLDDTANERPKTDTSIEEKSVDTPADEDGKTDKKKDGEHKSKGKKHEKTKEQKKEQGDGKVEEKDPEKKAEKAKVKGKGKDKGKKEDKQKEKQKEKEKQKKKEKETEPEKEKEPEKEPEKEKEKEKELEKDKEKEKEKESEKDGQKEKEKEKEKGKEKEKEKKEKDEDQGKEKEKKREKKDKGKLKASKKSGKGKNKTHALPVGNSSQKGEAKKQKDPRKQHVSKLATFASVHVGRGKRRQEPEKAEAEGADNDPSKFGPPEEEAGPKTPVEGMTTDELNELAKERGLPEETGEVKGDLAKRLLTDINDKDPVAEASEENLETPEEAAEGKDEAVEAPAPSASSIVSGEKMPLDETGYFAVAALHSHEEMKSFVRRVAEEMGFEIMDEDNLDGFVAYYSGEEAVQDMNRLREEMNGIVAKRGMWMVKKGDKPVEKEFKHQTRMAPPR